MNPTSYKGTCLLAMYDYIKENSDMDHHLTVGDIADGIQSYFDSASMESIRRNVIRHIDELLIYDERHINVSKANDEKYFPGDGSPGKNCKIWYEPDFTKTDMQFLIDAVVYSTHMSQEDRTKLLDKVTALRYPFHSETWARNIHRDTEELPSISSKLFLNLDWVSHAIAEEKCIDFKLNLYGMDKKLHPQKEVKNYSPYKLYLKDGVYYVAGVTGEVKEIIERIHADHPDSISPYAITVFEVFRISEIQDSKEQSYLPLQKTPWADKTLDEIVHAGFSIYGECIEGQYWGIRNVLLYANDFGIHTLVNTFGQKCLIRPAKREEYDDVFYVAEGRRDKVYRVQIPFLNIEEKTKLLDILIRYPTKDIKFVSPKEELKPLVDKLSHIYNSNC